LLAASGQPDLVGRAERKRATCVLYVYPGVVDGVAQEVRVDGLVELKAGLLKPLRGG